MEVSSHALEQERVFGVPFDCGDILEFDPRHLDYHRDMENYFAAKQLLFAAAAPSRRGSQSSIRMTLTAGS